MSSKDDAKDAFIRASAALTGQLTYENLEAAFVELSKGIVSLGKVPNVNRVAYKFGVMLSEQLSEQGRAPSYQEPQYGPTVVDVGDESEPAGTVHQPSEHCPMCGKPI